MTISRNLIIALVLAFTAFSCTDVIDLDANFENAELVVDAWITQEAVPQSITLSLSQDYYDATLPPAVDNATVILSNDTQGELFEFVHQGSGVYTWTPTTGTGIGTPGDDFSLAITYNDWTYASFSHMNDVPPVDSIVYEAREAELGNPAGIFAQFYARDLVGEGDTYWIKTFKNGQFLNKPSEMNISADGTFGLDSGADGIVFITPIREAINRVPDPDTDDNSDVSPYAVGDSIRVEIHAITNDAFRFLTIAQEQMLNSGLFALPLANSPSNIVPQTTDAPAALGFFNVSANSSLGILVE